ncbi:uncharacterized protein LOC131629107 isoform X1 [Vicia villosa]|uniref:uncharacterized protein LOC131629107 isoform X1 n=1 Tax=Vicia villosa TaxID=3911 RepID=UPI00273BDEBB|nr:uncharacterized protein LOC131629107 isoform X1 [Vicia villosa]
MMAFRKCSSNSCNWVPVILSETEYCPEAVRQYALTSHNRKTLKERVWKHLVYLGWQIHQDGDHFRYKPPHGILCHKKFYYSLIEICKAIQMESVVNSSSVAMAHCPQAIVEYHKHALDPNSRDKGKLISKIRNYLVNEGWVLTYPPPGNKRSGVLYTSPQKRKFSSLNMVCKFLIEESVRSSSISGNQPLNASSVVNEESVDQESIRKSPMYGIQPFVSDESVDWVPSDDDLSSKAPNLLPRESELYTVDRVATNRSRRKRDESRSLAAVPSPVAVAGEQATSSVAYCRQAVVEYHKHALDPNWGDKSELISKIREHLVKEGWVLTDPPLEKRRKGVLYTSPQKRKFFSLNTVCKFLIEESDRRTSIFGIQPLNASSVVNEEGFDQESIRKSPMYGIQAFSSDESVDRVPSDDDLSSKDRVATNRSKRKRTESSLRVRSNKRVQNVSVPSLSHRKALNVVSWLIDSNVVLPRSNVCYVATIQGVMASGQITHDGIKCKCCHKIYSLVSFEFHAIGSNTTRPSASIFLDDGRSLLQCQVQIMRDHVSREAMVKSQSDLCQSENDYICSICRNEGELLLCDRCPSSYHKTCLGLEDVPDGDWFCPSCLCGICGQRKFNGGSEDGHFLKCIQCEHKYHVACLISRDTSQSRSYVESQFCGKDCETLYEGLQRMLREPVSVGVDDLTWTLVKYIDSESCDTDSGKSGLLAESYSKLNVALSVMHECFEPQKEPSSGRDLVEDVIFSRWSELNRMNFQGFYTVLLEKDEELVSVAIIRVFGDKVAEVPLVGTRFQYRRQGMCHILMDELEKKLMQLGVKQLVLPALPSVVDTWTGPFGFSKMTELERSKFLDYTFLDFPGTIMCQKLLTKTPSPDSVLPIEFQQKVGAISESSSANKSAVSEVYQAGEIVIKETSDTPMLDAFEGESDNDNVSNEPVIDCVTMAEQRVLEDQQHYQNGTSTVQGSFENGKNVLKNCRRRKVEE